MRSKLRRASVGVCSALVYPAIFVAAAALAAALAVPRSEKKGSHERGVTTPRKIGGMAADRIEGAEPTGRARAIESYGKLPLSFELNQGQTDRRVRFLSRGSGYSLFLTGNEAVLALKKPIQMAKGKRQTARGVAQGFPRPRRDGAPFNPAAFPLMKARQGSQGSANLGFRSAAFPGFLRSPAVRPETNSRTAGPRTGPALQELVLLPGSEQFMQSFAPQDEAQIPDPEPRAPDAVLRVKLLGGNPNPKIVGTDELPRKSNYFIGNDPKKWRTNVPNYAKVRYANVYRGVDLVYYGNQAQLEYDFVVSPGADPRQIVLDVGAGLMPAQGHPQGVPLHVSATGDLGS